MECKPISKAWTPQPVHLARFPPPFRQRPAARPRCPEPPRGRRACLPPINATRAPDVAPPPSEADLVRDSILGRAEAAMRIRGDRRAKWPTPCCRARARRQPPAGAFTRSPHRRGKIPTVCTGHVHRRLRRPPYADSAMAADPTGHATAARGEIMAGRSASRGSSGPAVPDMRCAREWTEDARIRGMVRWMVRWMVVVLADRVDCHLGRGVWPLALAFASPRILWPESLRPGALRPHGCPGDLGGAARARRD